MKINKDSLSARINNISKKTLVPANVLYSRYFFDCFLSRLSKSPYVNNFVLKGGLYLSSILGVDNRSTIDIDFVIQRLNVDREKIITIINSICSIETDDNVVFKYVSDEPIRKEDIYGGFSITLEGKLENIRQKFDVDIGIGDPIFPSEVEYSYECLLDHKILKIKGYSIETVVSEKLQTFLCRGVYNSRAKDFYDLFIIEKLKINDKNENILKESFKKTCEYRNFEINKDSFYSILNDVSENKIQKDRWSNFANRRKYAENIEYSEIMKSIEHLLEIVLN